MMLTAIMTVAGLNFSKSEYMRFFFCTENLDLGHTNKEQSLVQEGEKGFAPYLEGGWVPSSREILIFHTPRKLSGDT